MLHIGGGMGELDSIGLKYGTDKSSNHHNYLSKYEKYFPYRRREFISIMEIGVQHGNSLYMWGEYYPNSRILGIDINPDVKRHEGGNIRVEVGSQVDLDFLSMLSMKYGKFDIILDDGSHRSPDQIFSFKHLFSSLNSGGIYVVEDANTAYCEAFMGGVGNPGNAMEYFKGLVDEVNFRGVLLDGGYRRDDRLLIEQERSRGLDYIGMGIESIVFMNSIVIVRKR